MGLFDKLRGELVDIVEWMGDNRNILVWRFPRYNNEIKNGAKLIVRPGQVAVFVNEGKLAEVFQPGTHDLTTQNLPILSTLKGWKFGFASPFKCEVYFVNTLQVPDLKWGTPNPIMLRDPDFGMVRVRAFGNYTLKAQDPSVLIRELVGTDGSFETEELAELLRGLIASSFASLLADSKVAALDLATRYREMSELLQKSVQEKIDDEYGLQILNLAIINISLPEAVEKAIDTRTSMGALGDMGKYTQYQMANSIPLAAQNPGGIAGLGAGLGVGMAMGSHFQNATAQSFGGAPQYQGAPPSQGMAPPPLPASAAFFLALEGTQAGPFDTQGLQSLAAQGKLNAQTMVWTAGMPQWLPAREVPSLNSVLASSPPPLPKI